MDTYENTDPMCTANIIQRFASFREDFLRDGVVSIPGALDRREMDLLETAFEWKLANAGEGMMAFHRGTFLQAIGGHGKAEVFQRVLHDTCVPDIAAALFGSGPVWFMEEQVFYKQAPANEPARRSAWHQDASFQPFSGMKNVVVWISFEALSKDEALEVVRGSHLGQTYNGILNDDEDDTKPVFPEYLIPRVPNIETDRAAWDIVSWPHKPGDVLAFHPNALHGGAPCAPGKLRRSIALRLFGDDCIRVEHPGPNRNKRNPDRPAYLEEFFKVPIGKPVHRIMSGPVRGGLVR